MSTDFTITNLRNVGLMADEIVATRQIDTATIESIFSSGILGSLDSMTGIFDLYNSLTKDVDEKLDILVTKRKENDAKIDDLNKKIEAEQKRIEAAISEAESIAEENKAAANTAMQNVLNQYRNGEIKQEELSQKIQEAVDNVLTTDELSALQDVISNAAANITSLNSQISSLQNRNNDINAEIELLSKEYKAIEETVVQEAKKQEEAKNCDPIGFQISDVLGNIEQFDFFVDRNGDGMLSDTTEFLGATADKNGKDGWSEMEAYDIDKDGVITYDELQNADVNGGELKVVVTKENADGTKTQQVKSLAEAFGSSNLEISASKNSTLDSTVGPLNFDDNLNNIMLGNFNVTLDGEQVVGYQTSDDAEFLKDNYTFSNDRTTTEMNTSRFTEGLTFNEYGGSFFRRDKHFSETSSSQIDQIESLIAELDKYERELV